MYKEEIECKMHFDELRCIHCGKAWGQHYGSYCNHWNSDTQFIPEGIKLTDICICGFAFEEHLKRKYCPKSGLRYGLDTFKKQKDNKLPEELFEI